MLSTSSNPSMKVYRHQRFFERSLKWFQLWTNIDSHNNDSNWCSPLITMETAANLCPMHLRVCVCVGVCISSIHKRPLLKINVFFWLMNSLVQHSIPQFWIAPSIIHLYLWCQTCRTFQNKKKKKNEFLFWVCACVKK